jgi:hypothetical protein
VPKKPTVRDRAVTQANAADLRKEQNTIKRLRAELASERTLREHAENELETWRQFEELVATTSRQPKGRFRRGAKKAADNAAVLYCVTDLHLEENIDPATINGLNAYDLDIAKKRIEKTFQKFIRLKDFAGYLAPVDEAYLWLGGDIINGYIHEELQESNFLGPTEAVLTAKDWIAAGIELLLRETDTPIRVLCNRGNHGRSTKKKRIATDYRTSWEYLLYYHLADYFRDEPRLSWVIPKGYLIYEDIKGQLYRLHHGDAIRYQGGVGGITIPVNKAIAQWNKARAARWDVFGHWHQFLVTWNFFAVGCGCGFGPYAEFVKAEPQPPSQGFALLAPEHGPVMGLPVYCG